VDIEALLPSFSGFRKKDTDDGIPIAIVTFMEREEMPEEDNMSILRSDISPVWGNNFRFYERENSYVTQINHHVGDRQWMMESTHDFKESVIYGNASDPRTGELLSWLLMVVFGQVGLQYQRILIHASVIAHRGKQGLAFLGKSGTGKSTHSRLWLQHVPETELLNDDNPAIRIEDNGKVFIYGTPWSGKTPCYKNKKVEDRKSTRLNSSHVKISYAVFCLKYASTTHIYTLSLHDALPISFLGKSGTGKSTHSRLWLQHVPETELLNDDNPAIRIEDNGKVFIYGTPWSGKTPCYKNKKV